MKGRKTMQLAIIDFIKSHSNWEELLSNPPYSLKIKRKDNLVLFNYSQIESDPSNEIVKEARGTIIEDETFKPICVGFKRFYNIDEPYAAKIDWNTAVATSKEDGTLFFLYWYNNKWHVKTRSTFDAEEAPMDNIKFANFKELFDYLISFYSNFSYEKLNKNYVYCLEGCSNFNRVVIEYNTPCLFHLMTRDMSTLQEINTEIGIPKPQMYHLNNEADYRKLVEDMPEGHEGVVVRDINNERVKLKTLLYFQMHRAKNNGAITLERIVDLIRANDQYEFLSYFCEYQSVFDNVKRQIDNTKVTLEKVRQDVAEWKNNNKDIYEQDARMARKRFVQDLGKNGPLYFAEYDGKLAHTVDSLETKKFISLFKIELKED